MTSTDQIEEATRKHTAELAPICFVCEGAGEVGIVNPQGFQVQTIRCPQCGGFGRCEEQE